MQPNYPQPYGMPSFEFPVEPPLSDPDAAPNKAYTINCDWLPYIRGALWQLVQQNTWKVSDPAALLLAQQRAMTLISMFDECATLDLPFTCDWNFVFAVGPWVGNGGTHLVPLNGYVGNVTSEDPCNVVVNISAHFSPAINVATIRVVGHRDDPVGGAHHQIVCTTAGVGTAYPCLPATPGNYDVTCTIDQLAVTDIEIAMGVDLSSGHCNDGFVNAITEVVIEGTATVSPC